jgi:hypothetical protein
VRNAVVECDVPDAMDFAAVAPDVVPNALKKLDIVIQLILEINMLYSFYLTVYLVL